MTHTHHYQSRLRWTGSTGSGYEAYEREHRVAVPPATEELRLSSDPVFLGNPDLPNPEQLLVAAASSCQLLMFLALAARSRMDEDDGCYIANTVNAEIVVEPVIEEAYPASRDESPPDSPM